MLYAVVKVSSCILSSSGRMPVREYEHPPSGCSKFLYNIQYRTPAPPKRNSAQNGDSYDYE